MDEYSILINTTEAEKTEVSLLRGEKVLDREVRLRELSSQIVLPMVSLILKRNGKKLADIRDIRVLDGRGSYTGVRVGFSVANMLGFILGIKVNGKNPRENMPDYS